MGGGESITILLQMLNNKKYNVQRGEHFSLTSAEEMETETLRRQSSFGYTKERLNDYAFTHCA